MDILTVTIAVISLIISGISLYFSFRKDRHEKNIISAQKKTEILKFVSDGKSRFERRLHKIKMMNKIWENCESCPTETLKNIEKCVEKAIEVYEQFFKTINKVNESTDPVLLERLIPQYYEIVQMAEDGFKDTKDLIEGCLACQQKAKNEEVSNQQINRTEDLPLVK